jgi:hypothetical protein
MKSVNFKREGIAMISYFLLAYEYELTDEQLAELSDICFGRTVEVVETEYTQRLHHALYVGREGLGEGYFYRLHSDDLPSGLFKTDPGPLYVGRFNQLDEVRGAAMSFYIGAAYHYKTAIKGALSDYETAFKTAFGSETAIADDLYKIVETEQWDSIEKIKAFFKERKVMPFEPVCQ